MSRAKQAMSRLLDAVANYRSAKLDARAVALEGKALIYRIDAKLILTRRAKQRNNLTT